MVSKHHPKACSQHPPLLPLPSCLGWGSTRGRVSTGTLLAMNQGRIKGLSVHSYSQSRRDGEWLQGAQPGRSRPPAAPEHCVLLQMAISTISTAAEDVQISGPWMHASSSGPECPTHTHTTEQQPHTLLAAFPPLLSSEHPSHLLTAHPSLFASHGCCHLTAHPFLLLGAHPSLCHRPYLSLLSAHPPLCHGPYPSLLAAHPSPPLLRNTTVLTSGSASS